MAYILAHYLLNYYERVSVPQRFCLIIIIFLALLTRLYMLGGMPPSLTWDEASHGYNAYSILTTGHDEWGQQMPTIFRAYGDYKLPVYIYSTVPSVAVFGLNAFAVRLPSAIAGILSVIFTYLLVSELFKYSKNVNGGRLALLAALLVAIEPWSLFASRAAFEANLAVLLIIVGVYFFVKAVNSLTTSYLLPATGFLGLSVWTYNSARVFVPLLLMAILFIYKTELIKTTRNSMLLASLSVFIMLLFLLPMFFQLATGEGSARYQNTKIIDDGAVSYIEEKRSNSPFPAPIPRMVYNKATFFSLSFAGNYVNHFSPQFLFLGGGSHFQFSVPGHGVLYLVNLPLFVFGLWVVVTKYRKTKHGKLLLAWLLLAPIAASTTQDSPHVLRSLIVLPTPMVFTALGAFALWDKLRNKSWMLIFYVVALVVSFAGYSHFYFNDYQEDYSWAWQYGHKEMVELVRERYDMYDKVIITKAYGEPHMFLLFHWPWEPEKYQRDPHLVRFYQSNWYWVDRFDKFHFVNDWDIPVSGSTFVLESGGSVECGKCLLVTTQGKVPGGWVKLDTVKFLDGRTAFEIYEN